MRFPRLRKMTWLIYAWSTFCLVWIIQIGASHQHGVNDHAAAGIAGSLVIVIWFMGFIVLSLIWFMTRPKEKR